MDDAVEAARMALVAERAEARAAAAQMERQASMSLAADVARPQYVPKAARAAISSALPVPPLQQLQQQQPLQSQQPLQVERRRSRSRERPPTIAAGNDHQGRSRDDRSRDFDRGRDFESGRSRDFDRGGMNRYSERHGNQNVGGAGSAWERGDREASNVSGGGRYDGRRDHLGSFAGDLMERRGHVRASSTASSATSAPAMPATATLAPAVTVSLTGNAALDALFQRRTAPSTAALLAPMYDGASAPSSLSLSTTEELRSVRQRYLGSAAASQAGLGLPPAPAKRSDKFSKTVKMEWDAADDTTDRVNPLYASRGTAAPSLLFGRGHQAGVDEGERSNASAGYMRALEAKRRTEAGAEEAAEVAAGAAAALASSALAPAADSIAAKHWSEKSLADMSERDWRIMREDFDIRNKGGRPCNPLRSWSELELDARLRRAVEDMGYTQPTPIQRQAVPMGMLGRDLIGVAETGSGKTAAFLIPLLAYVLRQPAAARAAVAELGPLALVMAPTRELAQQIEVECRKLCRHAGVSSVSVVGGTSIQEQGHTIREGIDVIIGTPGRLIDALEQSYMVLHQCRYVVLDEADRMIDLGFEPQVTAVFEAMGGRGKEHEEAAAAESASLPAARASAAVPGLASSSAPAADAAPPPPRTTHMFTATMPAEVERLAKKFMRAPATVKIGDEDSGKNKRITQEVIFLPSEARKRTKLLEVLQRCARPVIVFVNAKKQCDVVARDIEGAGFAVVVLHSGKAQDAREGALADFKAGTFDVLVATDVAGRGLDIPDVAQVVNYDMPSEIDRYTHRIGRTGRAGKSGKATTLLTEDDAPTLPALKAYLEATGQPVPPELAQRASGHDRPERVQHARR